MLRKRLNLFLMIICLFNVICLSTIVFKQDPVRAETKKVYKAELVPTGSVQATLDQRAGEGWQLVAASSHSTSINTDVTILIFEKH